MISNIYILLLDALLLLNGRKSPFITGLRKRIKGKKY